MLGGSLKGAIAVFVKTPGLSPVKTRLAKGLGKEVAETFYRKSLDCIYETLKASEKDFGLTPYWAVAEKLQPRELEFWNQFSVVEQSQGGLGERLESIYRQLYETYDYVLFMGADSPHLTRSQLIGFVTRFKTLCSENKNSCFFGPTYDGGFYLFASGAKIPKSCWVEGVDYSTNKTLLQLEMNLKALNIRTERFHKEFDVDTVDELEQLSLIPSSEDFNSSQKDLIIWSKSFFK